MTDREIARRLRRFLLALSGLVAGLAIVELLIIGHTGDAIQIVPFALLGLVCISAVVMLFAGSPRTRRLHRAVMIVVIAGSAFGVYEHVEENAAFEREIRPNAPGMTVFREALTGASPLMAPGVLTLAAVLGLAGTYGEGAERADDREQ